MRRREFISLLGGAAAAWPVGVRAQSASARRVGVLMNGSATEAQPQAYLATFVQRARALGWVDGQNVHIEVRWNAGDAQLARIYAAQLIGLRPDVIVAPSTTNLMAVRDATSIIPIVFLQVSDPVAQGFVSNLTKPDGNLTGFSAYEFSIGGKRLGLLKEAAPRLALVGVMFNPDTSPQSKFFMRSVETAARSLGVEASAVAVRTTAEIEPAFDNLARQSNAGLILPTDSFTRLRQKLIAELAGRYGLPSISPVDDYAKDGGLMSYGANINLNEHFRLAAGYVDRILKGAKPADLPVNRADKFSFVLNMKTAKALGLTVPLPLLGLADEVIE